MKTEMKLNNFKGKEAKFSLLCREMKLNNLKGNEAKFSLLCREMKQSDFCFA